LIPGISPLDAEIRARLWFTVAELTLESAMDAGVAPHASLSDFDVEIPADCNHANMAGPRLIVGSECFPDLGSRIPPGAGEVPGDDGSMQEFLAMTFRDRLVIVSMMAFRDSVTFPDCQVAAAKLYEVVTRYCPAWTSWTPPACLSET